MTRKLNITRKIFLTSLLLTRNLNITRNIFNFFCKMMSKVGVGVFFFYFFTQMKARKELSNWFFCSGAECLWSAETKNSEKFLIRNLHNLPPCRVRQNLEAFRSKILQFKEPVDKTLDHTKFKNTIDVR